MSAANAFGQVSDAALAVVDAAPDTPAADVAAVYGALLAFAGAVYPDDLSFVDRVLATCHGVSVLGGREGGWAGG